MACPVTKSQGPRRRTDLEQHSRFLSLQYLQWECITPIEAEQASLSFGLQLTVLRRDSGSHIAVPYRGERLRRVVAGVGCRRTEWYRGR
jgi:hypothetical protein